MTKPEVEAEYAGPSVRPVPEAELCYVVKSVVQQSPGLGVTMRRRDFITVVASTAAWPLAARAQAERMQRIGWLNPDTSPRSNRLNAFKHGLADLGWIEGRDLAFEERWPNSDPDSVRSAAAQLAALRLDLIFVANSPSLAAVR